MAAGEGDPARDVDRVVAAQDGQRPPVDHRVEHGARRVVDVVGGPDDIADQLGGHGPTVSTIGRCS
jgi:hypothetical protein